MDTHVGYGDYMRDKMKQANEQSDVITKPSHYERYDIEPVCFIMKNELPFWMGNVIKYVMRAGHKDNTAEVVDLKKARRYIDMRINQLEGHEPNEVR